MSTKLQVTGVEKALKAFAQLPPRMQFKHMRIALNAGAGVIRDRAKTIVLKKTRLLARSLTVKVKIPNASYNPSHWGKPEYALIGPSRRYFASSVPTQTARRFLKGQGPVNRRKIQKTTGRRIPGSGYFGMKFASRYAHVVEKGSKHMMGYSFLDTAVRTEGDVAQRKIIRKLEDGLKQEAAALSAGP